jgi:broad specificity phosphatase PhoE
MSKLILVRHAASSPDPCVAPSQWPLSDVGRQSCAALAQALAPYLPAALYSSREAKATETAALTARALGLGFAVRPGLQEHARTTDDWLAPEAFQAAVAGLFARPAEVVFGQESADQAHARFAAAVDGLLAEPAQGNIVVFTHGTVLTLFVSRAVSGIEPLDFLRRLGLPAVVVLSRPQLALEAVLPEVTAHGA